MKNLLGVRTLLLVIVVMLLFLCIVVPQTLLYMDRRSSEAAKELGETLVRTLYSFETLGELDDNMDLLQELVNEEVYQQLTIDRTDRSFKIYLKFKGNPVKVQIEDGGENYVVYSLISDSVSPLRKFILIYKVDQGRVSSVREAEIVDFPTNLQ